MAQEYIWHRLVMFLTGALSGIHKQTFALVEIASQIRAGARGGPGKLAGEQPAAEELMIGPAWPAPLAPTSTPP
jgi:hypothetical protein